MRMGLDVHKKLSYYSMVDDEGTEMKSEVADEHPWHRINKSEEKGKKWQSLQQLVTWQNRSTGC